MKKILDACCGSRMFWFDKENPDVEFVDNREFEDMQIWKSGNGQAARYCSIHPTTLADFTALPFPDNTFYHVVFDPPHLLKLGDNSWLSKKYGKLKTGWESMIHDGFWECMRVLRMKTTSAVMVLCGGATMTDNEIIEALERLSVEDLDGASAVVLDRVNRQKATAEAGKKIAAWLLLEVQEALKEMVGEDE